MAPARVRAQRQVLPLRKAIALADHEKCERQAVNDQMFTVWDIFAAGAGISN
jgi:hypothetical protein